MGTVIGASIGGAAWKGPRVCGLLVRAGDTGIASVEDVFFSSRRRHTRLQGDWSSDVCSSDLLLREQKAINFNSVAKAANVSKAYLYSQPQLRDRIETLRQQELEQTMRKRVAHPKIGRASCRERV